LIVKNNSCYSEKERRGFYENEIKQQDNKWHEKFHELFLVKESFALMYQMMQMNFEAHGQYEELEALLALAPSSVKEYGGWPIADSVHYFASQAFCDTHTELVLENGNSSDPESDSAPIEESAAPFYWSCREGIYRRDFFYSFYYFYLGIVNFRRRCVGL
jgi:hypothetical protein